MNLLIFNQKNEHIFLLLISVLLFFYSSLGLMKEKMYFSQDELLLNYWTNVSGFPPLNLFSTKHDDRPTGWALIYLLNRLNKNNYHIQLISILCLHLTNSFLLYILLKKRNINKVLSACGAIIFTHNFPANKSAFYIGAVFDITCCTFLLLSLIYYSNKYIYKTSLSLIFYHISVRSKEMSIFLPFYLLCSEFITKNTTTKNFAKYISPFLIILLLCIASYATRDFFQINSFTDGNFYQLNFSFNTIGSNFIHYVRQIIPDNNFILSVIILLYFIGLIQLNRNLIISIVGFVLFLLPVLAYKYHRADYFLYVPNIFFSMAIIYSINSKSRDCLLKLNFFSKLNLFTLNTSSFARMPIYLIIISLFFQNLSPNSSLNKYLSNEIKTREPLAILNTYIKNNFSYIKPETKFYLKGIPNISENETDTWHIMGYVLGLITDNKFMVVFTDNVFSNLEEKYLLDSAPKIFLEYQYGNYVILHEDM